MTFTDLTEVAGVQTTRVSRGEPVVDEFLDLVLGDPELLDAEFEAIITDSWSDPPERRPSPRPRVLGPGDHRGPAFPRSVDGSPRTGWSRPAATGRQRSPPRPS